MQLRFSIWRDLLAPLQIARIYVHAYPNSIDVVALAKCALRACSRMACQIAGPADNPIGVFVSTSCPVIMSQSLSADPLQAALMSC